MKEDPALPTSERASEATNRSTSGPNAVPITRPSPPPGTTTKATAYWMTKELRRNELPAQPHCPKAERCPSSYYTLRAPLRPEWTRTESSLSAATRAGSNAASRASRSDRSASTAHRPRAAASSPTSAQ